MIAWAAVNPVTLSGMIVRTIFGSPVTRSAWMSAKPDRAWMIGS